MKKVNQDSPYREQKQKRRWIRIILLLWIILFVWSPYLIDLFSFRAGTMDALVFDRLEMEQVQAISLTRLDDFDTMVTVEGDAMKPVLDLLGHLSIRTLFPQRLPKRIDDNDCMEIRLGGASSFHTVNLAIFEGEYLSLRWTPGNRTVTTYYRITDGTLDYDTLAALFPPGSEITEEDGNR